MNRRTATARRLAAGAGLTAGATLAFAGSAQAGTFTVSNLGDSGPGTLRQAMLDAAAGADADTITFASGLSGTISLGSDLPHIDFETTIQGPGPDQLTINGNGHAVFLAYSAVAANHPVSISGLTVAGQGAPVLSHSNLTISNSVISGSSQGNGAAIYAYQADLHLSNSTVASNSGRYDGGVLINHGTALIENTTISGNTAFDPAPGPPFINTGGGLEVAIDSKATVVDSTISGNTAAAAGGTGRGGGIYVFGGNGPMYPAGHLTLENTIVAGNAATAGPDIFGTADAAFSLIGNASGATITETVPGSNLTGVDPQLSPLANNGGPTPTQALAPASPAVDQGSSFGLAADQRGSVRPFDFPQFPNSAAAGADGSDIGAFELQPGSGKAKLKALKLNKKNGTAKQKIQLPLPALGKVKLFGKNLKKKTKQVSSVSGLVTLPVIPNGKLKAKLADVGKARVKEKVAYTPKGGHKVISGKKIKLIER
jgi:hypothetical protein